MSEKPSLAIARARAAGAGAGAGRRLPLAELHCHVEGSAPPALALELGRKYGVDLSAAISGGVYRWHDFSSFLAAYDAVSAVFRTADDYARLAEDHLTRLSEAGTIYAEVFISPDHATRAGIAPESYVEGLAEGLRSARDLAGIEARMIVVGVRHLGAERVAAAASFAARQAITEPLVTGFGLAGDERVGHPGDFSGAFDIARDAGLGLTAHAGEFCGAPAVGETIEALDVSRIGYGVRAIEDEAVVAQIAEKGIVLEVCPGSNLALGVYPDAAAHPLRRLVEAGCRVTLNSDDPPFFATDLAAQYRFAAEAGFDDAHLVGFTRNAVEAAFVDEGTRGRLLDRVTGRAISLGGSGASA